ncbi:hypothetical protein ONZ51_g10827 [Trametes cubensis]|uniref:6-phosphogluconolactonase n=1 Tax=Trametes cubensis TaxID=1111947 RepID=A0AAD7X4J1_9APHY|nr:hypothetical protein ONZ51_g10827 [Trametes cubensis]
MAIYRILVASYTNEIYTLAFEPDTASLTLTSKVTVGHHPSWITLHPKDKSIIFAGVEQTEGKIAVLKYDKEGRGTVIGEISSGGADPCSLLALDDQLLVGNYSSGTFAVVPLSTEPPHLLGAQTSVTQFSGTGPNNQRQEASHLHQVIKHPAREEVLVPDLGADKTRRLVRNTDGKWVEQGVLSYKAGSGPRHVAFHEDVLYTLLELTSEVAAHRFPPLLAEPTLLDTVTTMAQPPLRARRRIHARRGDPHPTPERVLPGPVHIRLEPERSLASATSSPSSPQSTPRARSGAPRRCALA